MGKQSAPPAPDYAALAASSAQAAQIQAQTSADQLAWAKQQYADMAPQTHAYMDAMTSNMNQQTSNAQQAQQTYNTTYLPIEQQFASQATNYNSPARAAQNEAAAQGDVASAFAGQRQAALTSLEGYGIDPSQTRFGALDLGTRVSQAAAMATAGTQSRLQTEAMGLSLEGQAINTGRGYPSQVNQSYQGAAASGGQGIQAGLNTSNTYGNLMGTANQWANTSNNALGVGANVAAAQGQYGLGIAQANAQQSAGIGSLIGGLGMAGFMKYSDIRLKEDVRPVGETHGGLPVYTYRYKGDPARTPQMGVMAQDVAKVNPRAVGITPSGYLAVDYSRVN